MINNISFPNLGWSFEVDRVAFSIFGVDIYAYGFLIGVGLLLAFVYGAYESKKVDLEQNDLLNMILICLPAAIVGARLYYVAFEWGRYKDDLMSILNLREGGLAIYGGVIGAAIGIFAYCKVKKINIGKPLDILAIGLLIGQAIGRWGNFVNGEAYGGETTLPWAMTIVKNGMTTASCVHPTFFYESLWNVIGFCLLFFTRRKKTFEGEIFCRYMIWYGVGRAMIEGLRADSLYIGPLRVSQILSLCLVVAGIAIIFYMRKKLNSNKGKKQNSKNA